MILLFLFMLYQSTVFEPKHKNVNKWLQQTQNKLSFSIIKLIKEEK